MTRTVVVGPHPPDPGPAALVTARLCREAALAGDDLVMVAPVPSAADRAMPLRGMWGALTVARLAGGGGDLHLVLAPGLVSPSRPLLAAHRARSRAWRAAFARWGSVRVHVVDEQDLVQLGELPPGVVVERHGALPERAGPPAPPSSWETAAAAVRGLAARDRGALADLRLPSPPVGPRRLNQVVTDTLRDRYGDRGDAVVRALMAVKRAARRAAGRPAARPGA